LNIYACLGLPCQHFVQVEPGSAVKNTVVDDYINHSGECRKSWNRVGETLNLKNEKNDQKKCLWFYPHGHSCTCHHKLSERKECPFAGP
jgi:hypothetical protein